MSTGPHNVPRWFSLSDGTLTFQATLYEALNYSQDISPLGGYSTIRMLDGTAVKQSNWLKHSITISGNGGVPLGMSDLDYTKPITLKCGAPRSMVRTANSFVLPTHRTDTGYSPTVLKFVDGFWIPLAATGTASKYMTIYYPEFTCFFDPPEESYSWDSNPPVSWSLKGEEV